MKRRTFLQATLLAAPAAHAGIGDRLHGVPGSIATEHVVAPPRFTLPLSRAGVPSQFWPQLDAIAQAVHDAMHSPAEGAALASNPAHFLRSRGFDASDVTLADESVRLAVALADPGIQGALAARDHAALFLRLEHAGVLRRAQAPVLQRKLEAILVENASALQQVLRERTPNPGLSALLEDETRTATIDDLSALRDVLAGGMDVPQRMAVLIAVIAIAVSVIVSVGVAMVVAVAVHVWGRARAGGIARLDADLIEHQLRAQRIGAIVGDPGIAEYAMRDLIRAESTALVDAMHATRIVRIAPNERDTVIDALTSYSLKVACP